MTPELCHYVIASPDEREMFHDCIMWKGHDGSHVCRCGHTYRTAPHRSRRPTR